MASRLQRSGVSKPRTDDLTSTAPLNDETNDSAPGKPLREEGQAAPSVGTSWPLQLLELAQSAKTWYLDNRPRIEAGVSAFVGMAIELANATHKAFTQRLQVYPQLFAAITPLAKRGWFISLHFGLSELDELAVISATKPEADLDKRLGELYAEDLSLHASEIAKKFPDRAFAINAAAAAHARGEFALSVPVFFIQADGICFVGAGKHLFQGQQSENFISHAQNELLSDKYPNSDSTMLSFYNLLWKILLTSMSDRLPLQYSPKERGHHQYAGLNRHTILHGIAGSEYATEENSLKAFSLLSCVASLLATD